MIFIFTATKLKRKIIFVALRINKKFTFYCDKLSIETKKSQIHTPPPSTQLRYLLFISFVLITQFNKYLNKSP
jgi:hypothetical protein